MLNRVAESKKPKIFKNGRSYRPLFIAPYFSLNNEIEESVIFCAFRLPKNQKFLKTDVPIDRYSLNNEIEESVGKAEFLKTDVPIDRYSIV